MGQLNMRYKTADEGVKEKSQLLNSYDQTMKLMLQLTKDCNENEKTYLEQLYNRGRNIEKIQRERKMDKMNLLKMSNSNISKSTKHNTLAKNNLSSLKNNNSMRDLKDMSLANYNTIKFVKKEEDKNSEGESEALKDKLEVENAI